MLSPHIIAGATHIVVAMPGAGAERRAQAIALARQTRLPVLTVPPRRELSSGPIAAEAPAGHAE